MRGSTSMIRAAGGRRLASCTVPSMPPLVLLYRCKSSSDCIAVACGAHCSPTRPGRGWSGSLQAAPALWGRSQTRDALLVTSTGMHGPGGGPGPAPPLPPGACELLQPAWAAPASAACAQAACATANRLAGTTWQLLLRPAPTRVAHRWYALVQRDLACNPPQPRPPCCSGR